MIQLVHGTRKLLDAALEDDPARFKELLGVVEIAEGWAGFPEVLPHLRSAYLNIDDEREGDDWRTRFFVHERTLVGMGGYKGPPDDDGAVEIGYAIAPAFQRRGFATEASRQMIERSFADQRVWCVDAHTLGQANASTRVLEKLGFERIGEREDPTDGPIWHWRLTRV